MEQKPSLTDWQRLVMGDAPWIFLIELTVRAMLVYLTLLLFMRWMGKRVAAQMSASELAVILMMGAAIGLPIQVPDKGLLPGLVVLGAVLVMHRGVSFWTFRSRRAEVATYGDVIILLKDGRLLPEALKSSMLSPHKIFASLRASGIEHLGQLRRVYVEASGDLSLIRYRQPRPGLLIIPWIDPKSGRYRIETGQYACSNCGSILTSARKPTHDCDFCGADTQWCEPVMQKSE